MLSPIVQRNLKEVIAVLFLTSAYLTVTYAFSRSHTSLSATIAIDIAIAILAVCLITSTLLLKDNTRPNWKIFYIPLSIALIATSSTYIYFAYFDLRIIKPGHPTTEYILLFIYTAFLTQLALSKPTKNQNEPKYYWGDLLLLPLLCHPLINYISHNQDYFTARSTLDFFARLIGPPLALLVIAQYTQSKYLSYKLLTPVILAFFFVRYSMPM